MKSDSVTDSQKGTESGPFCKQKLTPEQLAEIRELAAATHRNLAVEPEGNMARLRQLDERWAGLDVVSMLLDHIEALEAELSLVSRCADANVTMVERLREDLQDADTKAADWRERHEHTIAVLRDCHRVLKYSAVPPSLLAVIEKALEGK